MAAHLARVSWKALEECLVWGKEDCLSWQDLWLPLHHHAAFQPLEIWGCHYPFNLGPNTNQGGYRVLCKMQLSMAFQHKYDHSVSRDPQNMIKHHPPSFTLAPCIWKIVLQKARLCYIETTVCLPDCFVHRCNRFVTIRGEQILSTWLNHWCEQIIFLIHIWIFTLICNEMFAV